MVGSRAFEEMNFPFAETKVTQLEEGVGVGGRGVGGNVPKKKNSGNVA